MTIESKKYLQFVEVQTLKKTKEFNIFGQMSSYLGIVKFRPQWRKYVFEPEPKSVYDASCLIELSNFCNEQTIKWQKEIKEKNNGLQ